MKGGEKDVFFYFVIQDDLLSDSMDITDSPNTWNAHRISGLDRGVFTIVYLSRITQWVV